MNRPSVLFARAALGLMFVVGCTKPAAHTPGSRQAQLAELGLLMKNDINPAFSKLTFLVFHGAEMGDDRQALTAERQLSVAALRKAIGRLRVWSQPPTASTEGKEVFYTLAASIDKSAERLELAIGRNDDATAARSLEQIAETCNSCHHFFRLKVEDADAVPRTTVGSR